MTTIATRAPVAPIANSRTPIVSVLCHEPEGDIIRNVYPMDLTAENIKQFWEKSRKFRYIFSEDVTKDFSKFCALMLSTNDGKFVANGLYWVVDDFVGMFNMTQMRPPEDAFVHYTFFDRRQKGRIELVRAMLTYVFKRYQFRRLTAEIPYYVSWSVLNFAESIGFTKEGRKRKAAFFNDDWFDVAIFGILREEVLNAEQD